MYLTDERQFEIATYGTLLTGDESALDKARLARIQYLKNKMRPRLAALIGDMGDNLTDVCRAVVLGEAIRLGLVTDKALLDRHTKYIAAMLEGYGGAASIITVLEKAQTGLYQQLVEGYYAAKAGIYAAKDEDAARIVDLPGEPVAMVDDSI